MSDLISREDALGVIERMKHRLMGEGMTYGFLIQMLNDLPSAEPKTGNAGYSAIPNSETSGDTSGRPHEKAETYTIWKCNERTSANENRFSMHENRPQQHPQIVKTHKKKGNTMNSVQLIGRLTKDPEIRYTTGSQMAVATFNLAVDRPTRQGEEKRADFPRITVFGKQAENCEKYLAKGRKVAIEGRIQTGSYQSRTGETVYTTDVVATRVEFIEWGERQQEHHAGGYSGGYQAPPYTPRATQTQPQSQGYQERPYPGPPEPPKQMTMAELPEDFEQIDDDVPFD